MKKIHNLYAILIAAAVFVADRITKILFDHLLEAGQSIAVIRSIFYFTLVENQGAGFGILQGGRIFFVVFSFIVLAFMIHKWKKIPETVHITVPMGLALGGLLGNLVDRMFSGYVIDFIDLGLNAALRWPVFNVADSAITVGVIWLVIYLWNK